MILNRQQTRWAVGTGAASLVALAIYIVYAVLSPNGPRGGSLMGLFFASVGTGIIVFECLLGLRKKYPALLAPTRFGNYLCWRPEIAQVVAALISARKVEAHASY